MDDKGVVDPAATATQLRHGAAKVATVEEDDGRGDEVERGGTDLLVFEAAVAEATEPMEGDGTGQAVAGLPLVELGSDEAAKRSILEPAQGEQRALDASDLTQCRSKGKSIAARGSCRPSVSRGTGGGPAPRLHAGQVGPRAFRRRGLAVVEARGYLDALQEKFRTLFRAGAEWGELTAGDPDRLARLYQSKLIALKTEAQRGIDPATLQALAEDMAGEISSLAV